MFRLKLRFRPIMLQWMNSGSFIDNPSHNKILTGIINTLSRNSFATDELCLFCDRKNGCNLFLNFSTCNHTIIFCVCDRNSK